NASRTPQQAAEHLALVGVDAEPAEFVTSPQVASRLLAERLGPGAQVLVVGRPSLAEQIRLEGLEATFEDEREVAAVVQGWSPDLNWERLAEGRSEEHTSELQSRFDLVCRLLLEKKRL